MLEVTHGRAKNQMVANEMRRLLLKLDLDGSLYIGYPVLATADESVTVDALLVTLQHGLVAFLFDATYSETQSQEDYWARCEDLQNQLYVAVENNLRRHQSLRSGRRLTVDVQTVTVVPTGAQAPEGIEGEYCDLTAVPELLSKFSPISEESFRPLQAALQRVSTIKAPKRRNKVSSSTSRGAVIRRIESEIANLDQWQKRAAIESPEGPQRIRGLAGSGKTIVLALKAAYLHSENPDWNIAVTFSSQALYQQFEDLVRRFSFEHSNNEPNWENLRILHAWGGRGRDGLYQQVAINCGVTPRNYLHGRSMYGRDRAFEGVCNEFLSATANITNEPMFDAVLIDEAQDLPASFFQMVYRMVAHPKRIIWAYDELQQLSEMGMPTIDDLFGKDHMGQANVTLVNSENAPQQDIVLPICYRNTPWALALAHGLGMGTSRGDGLVQSFDDPSQWTDVGYRVVEGELQKGSTVTLERAPDSYPSYFNEVLNKDDAVEALVFPDAEQQARWVAQSVKKNIEQDELEHDDILIVLPDAYTSKSQAAILLEALNGTGINGHLVGVTSSQDEMFKPNSVAIAHIYRSKGNESPMVYILNSHQCVRGPGLSTLRSILFTAITRSKAWVRICGWGTTMNELLAEIESMKNNDYRLKFRIPTDDQLREMRRIHRELSASERARANEAETALRNFFEALKRGDTSVEDLPIELRTDMAIYFSNYLGDSADDAR